MIENTIFEIYGSDASAMTMQLMEVARVAERIPAKDARIALKPNLVLEDVPENGAVTHPGVVEGCIRYLRENGFFNIVVIESSWIGARTDGSLQKSGLADVCRACDVPFYDLKKDEIVTVETPFRPIAVSKMAYEADYLIDLPVLKGHCQTRMTCAIKNLKGCIPDREKRQFHADGLMEPIAALAVVLKPDLVIVDSICGDLHFEEGGNPIRTNRMFLGFDAVNVDAYSCRLMGLSPEEVGYLPLAAAWGAGELSLDHTKILRLNESTDSEEYPSPGGLVAELTKNVQARKVCSACYASLVRALYLTRNDNRAYTGPIAIGQGWKGKTPEGLGIGACCRGAGSCVPGCPPSARDIVECLEKQLLRKG